MAFALARVTPCIMQRLQVPVQVLIYAGLFIACLVLGTIPTWWRSLTTRSC